MITRSTMNHRRHVGTSLVLGLLLLSGLEPALAVTQIESTYGGQSPWFSAELNAQSVTGAALYRGGVSNILNPAGIAQAGRVRLDIGTNASYHEEDRYLELFDSFENYVAEYAVASNQNTWWGAGYALAAQLDGPPMPVGIALSLVDRYPFAYSFEEELRDPDVFSSPRDRILEERQYEVDGTIRQLSLGLAAEPATWLAFGASIHYAFGDRNESISVRDNDVDDGDDSFVDTTAWSLSGVNATFGLQSRVSDRVHLGLAYETRLNMEGDYRVSTFSAGDEAPSEVSQVENIRYPDYWRFGVGFFPRSDPRTVFTLDVVYGDWSKLQDSRLRGDRVGLQEVLDWRVGLQHTFHDDFDMRFGFRRYDSYADEEGGNSVFSAGGGFPVAAGQLSISIELNKQQVRSGHIFEYPNDEDFVSALDARVDDIRTRFGIGWSREF